MGAPKCGGPRTDVRDVRVLIRYWSLEMGRRSGRSAGPVPSVCRSTVVLSADGSAGSAGSTGQRVDAAISLIPCNTGKFCVRCSILVLEV